MAAPDPNANAVAAVSPPSRQPSPFLLKDNDTIEKYWLDNWTSGFALIVGGSVDIKRVRGAVSEQLERENLQKDIQICVLHASLWGGKGDKHQQPYKYKPRGKFLLLATHTLFTKKYIEIRDKYLMRVFDTCEKHEIHWPDASHQDMGFLRHFGLCDVLVTLSITKAEQQSRREQMKKDFRYFPKFIVEKDDPYPDLDVQKWLARNGQLPFFGLPLPAVDLNDSFWDNLFLCETDDRGIPGQMKVGNEEVLQFNALPLNFLLQKAVMEHRPPHETDALTLALCAVQVVTSRGFAPIFQHKRTLNFDGQVIWRATETAVFLGSFLTAGGRWSKEATLVHLTLQHLNNVPVDELRNLQGRQVRSYLEPWEQRKVWLDWEEKDWSLENLCRQVLAELMRVMVLAHQCLLRDLWQWCENFTNWFQPRELRQTWTWHGLGQFVEDTLRDSATRADKRRCVPIAPTEQSADTLDVDVWSAEPKSTFFQFVFHHPRQWDVETPRLSRDRNQPDEVVLLPSEALAKIGRYYLSHVPRVKQGRYGPTLAFPFRSGSPEEDRLVACVMMRDLVLEHDEDLYGWKTTNMLGLEEREFVADPFIFKREAWECHQSGGHSLCDFDRRMLERESARFGAITFATPPMQFYRPDAKEALQGSQIYVLKRFTTPDLLVLSSCVLGSMPQQARHGPDPWDSA